MQFCLPFAAPQAETGLVVTGAKKSSLPLRRERTGNQS